MKRLLFVTGNINKVNEAKELLSGYQVMQHDLALAEHQGTAEYIVLEKARHAFLATQKPLFVDDTSLCLHALNGFPGPFIKHLVKANDCSVIPRMLKGFTNKKATAYAMIGYIKEEGNPLIFIGKIDGTIVDPRGSSGFGWDPVFLPDGEDTTFAEMTKERKNAISHRRDALVKLKEYLDHENCL